MSLTSRLGRLEKRKGKGQTRLIVAIEDPSDPGGVAVNGKHMSQAEYTTWAAQAEPETIILHVTYADTRPTA
jgi:hypothetical protein